MKRFLILTTLLFIALLSNAQIVSIPDANFKAALVGNSSINTNLDSEIQVSEALAFTGYIDVAYKNITDLTGVESFLAITQLKCSRNQLTALDVTNNTALTSLDCYDNQLTALDVTNNTALTTLMCMQNQLTALDVTNNTALTTLTCGYNLLTALDVTNNTALTRLWCSSNQLTTLDVTNNTALTTLWCGPNQLTALDLTNNIALTRLTCPYSQLTALDVRNGNSTAISNDSLMISGNPNLTCVNVDDPVWSAANWTTNVDPQTSFSSNCCGNMEVYIDSVEDVSCVDSGFAYVSVSGGLFPYTYQWNTLPIDNDSSITVGSNGIYTVTVTDGNSCARTTGALINGPGLIKDLNSTLSSIGLLRPGLFAQVNLHAFNDGCIPTAGQVAVVINGLVTYDSASVTPDAINGDTLFWDFTDWISDSLGLLSNIYLTVDSSANIGDRICFEVILTPLTGDWDTSNNIKNYCFDVRNSFDPNVKEVHPAGVCAENFTQKGERLTYTVQFQNTGNDDAFDIYILDTLDSDLDVNTLRVLSQSHEPLITEVLDGNVVKFRFDNINLPDSNSNEKESHGYVTYEISPKTGLADGTVINNTAGIYFDLNPPVITNTTLNTMVDVVPSPTTTVFNETTVSEFSLNGQTYTETGAYKQYYYSADGCDSLIEINLTRTTGVNEIHLNNISVYPNPFSEYIDIQLKEYDDIHIKLFNVVGQEQSVKIENQVSIQRIDGSHLENGIYIVQIFDKGALIGKVKVLKN